MQSYMTKLGKALPKLSRIAYEVRNAGDGRGLGLFITQDIQPGNGIVSERPLLVAPAWNAFKIFSDNQTKYSEG
jgi:hypothetical protein